ncbi:hypothetical protein J7T55_001058 [Diaporthe amygdali]|uniref:uncharacterized protein n=1 Tax=Phomopsis amygdali TaxID=1214568 RepID=UPI0022FE59A0|nr:uncharacterized protein J7T55_001058 [Diaporthe amygdali]KAJ0120202.1 hypothetical protein J7T55_001058 [Diaporthe amygdali]
MGKVQGQQGKDSKLQARHCFWVVLMVLMATKGAQRAESALPRFHNARLETSSSPWVHPHRRRGESPTHGVVAAAATELQSWSWQSSAKTKAPQFHFKV